MSEYFAHKNQFEAEDVILYHRFRYYVLRSPIVNDVEFDAMQRELCERWSVNVCSCEVGSDKAANYPAYVREGRRPLKGERAIRDRMVVERWMKALDKLP